MNKFRSLPSVSVLLAEPWVEELSSSDGRTLVTATIRKVLDDHRQQIIDDADNWQAPDWKAEVSQSLSNQRAAKTTRAINGTGILLHTGLGRAVMPDVAVDSLNKHLRGNTQLEIDPHTGKRSTRDRAAGDILCELFGAEDSLVVNNNAAATLLILHSLCEGKEVVISRGELVEIGGSFRMPEIMVQSRCELKEVGSTNKAYLKDFEDAISDNTGLIMQAHTSNYKIVGFTRTVPIEELIALGKEKNLPFVHDIGSGAFFDMQDFKLPTEPLPAHSLKAGSDLVFFSGDKLLGGPQAGIILGKKKYVEMCRKNPLARALRVDKMALLALEATLTLYREDRFKEVPLYSRLSKSIDDIKAEAEDLKAKIPTVFEPRVEEYAGAMGSGSMPASPIPSYRVVLNHAEFSAEDLAAQLRRRDLPIYGTIHDSLYGINLLAMLQGDADLVIEALEELAK